MRELVVLLAAILAIGGYFSGGKPAPAPDPGYELVAEGADCENDLCREMRVARPGIEVHAARD